MPVLAGACFAVAFWQRPGREITDSRIELSADPTLFLHRVAAMWSPTADLGHVHAGQFVGFLFPMGPWYALGQGLGVPMWITQRLWLGTLLALGAWGAVRLVDALYDCRRGLAHATAGVLFAFNPYTAMFTNRASDVLQAYVIVPWLLLAVRHGIRDPRGWRAPAAIGLLLACSGGGTNATFTIVAMAGPVALAAYEWAVLGRRGRDVLAFGGRVGLCAALATAWWVVPLALSSASSSDFLSFTEQPAGIWKTTSMSEALRLLGYWPMYLRIAFQRAQPSVGFADEYLLIPLVVAAGFALAAAAAGGLWWTRRWAYAPFFALLWVGALVAMTAGFPEGTPLHGVLVRAYYEAGPLQILRTTYKAAPLAALAMAMLVGVGADLVVRQARAGHLRLLGVSVRAPALLLLAALPVLAALPLFDGHAINRDVAYGRIPAYWRAAMGDAQGATTANQRIALLPGELFGAYRWGTTNAPLGPALVRRPVLDRWIARYADPRSTQLQAAVDDLVQHVSLTPGQLVGLLRLLGVGQVVVPADGDRSRNWAVDPVGVVRALADQPEFRRPVAAYGARRRYQPELGRSGPTVELPALRRYVIPGPAPGIVRALPLSAATVLEGDGDGVAELAATGALPSGRALFYAGDVGRAQLGDLVRGGARLVFSDSNRRRPISSTTLTENYGPTLGPGDALDRSWPHYDPFPALGAAGRTVAVFSGLRWLRTAPAPLLWPVLPEHRAFAALDGRLDTAWLPDAAAPARRWIELALQHPRPVQAILVHPHVDPIGATAALAVSVNGGAEHVVQVHRGWNRIVLDATPLRTLRVRIAAVTTFFAAGLGGIDELRIPGLGVKEALRLPTSLANRARGLDLSRTPLSVVLERTMADDPYRAGNDVGDAQARDRLDMVDAEPGLRRIVTLPAGGAFSVTGWASVTPMARDSDLDALAGLRGGWRFDSSSRFEGLPARRASAAFDRNRSTAWVGNMPRGRTPWLAWRSPRPVRFARLRIVPGAPEYAAPARVRLRTPGGLDATVAVGPGGVVRLARPVRTRALRIDIVGVQSPTGLAGARLLRAVSVSEVSVQGLRPPAIRHRGPLRGRCGMLRISSAGGVADLVVGGDLAQFDAGRPLHLAGCGRASRLPLRDGPNLVDAPPGVVMRPDHLRLDAGPPPPRDPPLAAVTVRADAAGTPVTATVAGRGPRWLVLGESYDAGWRARCETDGHTHDLGRPLPIDGFANGWRAPDGCSRVRFAFAPQSLATVAYAVSALALAAMLAVLLLGARARLPPRPELGIPESAPGLGIPAEADPLRRAPLPVCLAAAAAVALVAGFVFALRMGAALGPATGVLLYVGVSMRRLLALACAGLAVVTVLYLATPSRFVSDHLTAHWVAVAVVWAVGAAGLLAASAVRRAAGRSGASDR